MDLSFETPPLTFLKAIILTIIFSPEGGLSQDSIAMAAQVRVLSKKRLFHFRGILLEFSINQLNQALLIALNLDLRGLKPVFFGQTH